MAATHGPHNGPLTVHVVDAENLLQNQGFARVCYRKNLEYWKHTDLDICDYKDTPLPVKVMDAQPGLPWLTQRLKVIGPASALRNRGFKYYVNVDFWAGTIDR